MLLDLLEPVTQVGECLFAGYVEGKEHNLCATVEDASNRSERFLACCVPNLELDNLPIKSNDKRTEFDANSNLMLQLELVVHHSGKQTTLADAYYREPGDVKDLPVSPMMINL